MLRCKLLRLHCYMSDELKADEVFLKANTKKIWPLDSKYVSMSRGAQIINITLPEIEEETSVQIELWDYDTWSSNDKLGVFKMIVDEKGGIFTSDLIREKGSGAKYSLEWEAH